MSTCETGNGYDGQMGARISSIFVILVGSAFGAVFPVFAQRHQGVGIPSWVFFIAKYFGSGVIVATAFIHLLAPANEALGNECLTGPITDYPWPEGIALMVVFTMFFAELMTVRYARFGHSHDEPQADAITMQYTDHPDHGPDSTSSNTDTIVNNESAVGGVDKSNCPTNPHTPGDNHLGHTNDHVDLEKLNPTTSQPLVPASENVQQLLPESYAAQLTAIFILEFGVIFHSIFIGLTLAVAGSEFATLYVVLVFHQTFEGLGLGTRLASVPWPKTKRWTPYLLGAAYAISTPIAIAIGLGVRNTYPPESQTTLVVNGVFDSISAGILIYTGLVELMAHEFMFSSYMRQSGIKTVLSAFGAMCCGAGLMALLGKWA